MDGAERRVFGIRELITLLARKSLEEERGVSIFKHIHFTSFSSSLFLAHVIVTAAMVSLKHLCFLRDARTNTVMGEPRFDLPIIPLLATYLPQEFNRVRSPLPLCALNLISCIPRNSNSHINEQSTLS